MDEYQRMRYEAMREITAVRLSLTSYDDPRVNEAACLCRGRPLLEVRCSVTDSRKFCGELVAPVWHTALGDVIKYQKPFSEQLLIDTVAIHEARVHQHNERVALGEALPLKKWQRRAPLWDLAIEEFAFLDFAGELPVFCTRHGAGYLSMADVRTALHQRLAGGNRRKMNWTPVAKGRGPSFEVAFRWSDEEKDELLRAESSCVNTPCGGECLNDYP
jgi:hypothetical protein